MTLWVEYTFTGEARVIQLLFILIIFTLLGLVASDFFDALMK